MSANLKERRQVILALGILKLFFDWKILNGNGIITPATKHAK